MIQELLDRHIAPSRRQIWNMASRSMLQIQAPLIDELKNERAHKQLADRIGRIHIVLAKRPLRFHLGKAQLVSVEHNAVVHHQHGLRRNPVLLRIGLHLRVDRRAQVARLRRAKAGRHKQQAQAGCDLRDLHGPFPLRNVSVRRFPAVGRMCVTMPLP